MSREFGSRRLPVVITLVVGLMLSIMPLPASIQAFRPDWIALLLVFWAMQLPRTWSVGTAWIVTVKFHLLMRVFPLSQLTATVFALLALYQFLLFWINGVAGVTAPPSTYWGPVITGTLLWPFFYMFLSGVRFRSGSRA